MFTSRVLKPTAVQTVGAVQDTSFRLACPRPGIGGASIDQRWPFQFSISGTTPFASVCRLPTAVQEVADGQDTPRINRRSAPRLGPANGAFRQVVPFHHWARALNVSPQMAMQAERVAQETPMPVFPVVTTCCTLATVHFVPFQVSTRPRISSFFTGSNDPEATQNVGDRQDTATSELRKLPAGTAARAIGLQAVPFQTEYVGLFRFAAVIPTARQNDGDVQDSACMPLSSGLGCPGAGAGAQCWPSHRSAPAAEPRARQKVADGQDRLLRKPWLALAG